MTKTPSTERAEKPLAPPPILYLATLAIGLVLDQLLPLLPFWKSAKFTTVIGAALILLALVIFASALMRFKQAGTHLPHWMPTTALVTDGIFARSRNPIYVAMTMLYLGIALIVASPWMLILLPLLLIVMQQGVIKREETYLREKFGQAYIDYCARVRRWL